MIDILMQGETIAVLNTPAWAFADYKTATTLKVAAANDCQLSQPKDKHS